ncbi:BON domain-containing protein [Nitrosomonas supralitoralis]|uniref:Osmotically-inducible protein Y n=1 Tax=Nitrosomonas supralitoralis TaxID=2116706 RepID=A0A2P7NU39_9PROT|nr:BON domain-containing protein [Nitrosomonas supralitoralis]PSJ16948.1 transporter [Nitrosomonas supralitoralis]
MTQLNSRSLAFIFASFFVLLFSSSYVHASEAGEYIDDTVITTKVKAALFNEPDLKSTEINVETVKGIVHLSGSLSNQADIDRAVEVTRNVSGVSSVENNIQIK